MRRVISQPVSAQQLDRDALNRLLLEIWADHPWVHEYGQRLVDLTWRGVEQLGRMGLLN